MQAGTTAHSTRSILVTLLLATALTSVGCGDDGDSLPAPGSTTIRMGFSAWPGWFPWQIALEEGLFAANGLDVELIYYDTPEGGYIGSLNAMVAGDLDANSQTLNDTLAGVAAGSDQVIVLVNDNSTGNDQCIAREGISRVEDLVGATVAVEFGVVDHFLLLLALRRAGVDESQVTIINELTDVAAQNFADGMYDAVCVFAPFTTTALGRAGSTVLVSSASFPGAIPDYLVVSRDLVDNYPGDVQALVDTWWQIRAFQEREPARAVEIMAARAGVSVEDYNSYAAGTTLFTIEQNVEALGPPPAPCSELGQADARLYTQCTAEAVADFLLNDASFIDAPIPPESLRRVWTDEFVLRSLENR